MIGTVPSVRYTAAERLRSESALADSSLRDARSRRAKIPSRLSWHARWRAPGCASRSPRSNGSGAATRTFSGIPAKSMRTEHRLGNSENLHRSQVLPRFPAAAVARRLPRRQQQRLPTGYRHLRLSFRETANGPGFLFPSVEHLRCGGRQFGTDGRIDGASYPPSSARSSRTRSSGRWRMPPLRPPNESNCSGSVIRPIFRTWTPRLDALAHFASRRRCRLTVVTQDESDVKSWIQAITGTSCPGSGGAAHSMVAGVHARPPCMNATSC